MNVIDAMDFLDDDLICGADEYIRHPIPLWRYGAAAAACICAAGGAAVLSRNPAPDVARPSDSIVFPANSMPDTMQPSDSIVLPASSALESTPDGKPAVIFNGTGLDDVVTGNFFCIYYDEKISPKMSRGEMLEYLGIELPSELSGCSEKWSEVRSDPDAPYIFLCCVGDVLEQYEFTYKNAKSGKTARISLLKRDGSSASRLLESLPKYTEEVREKFKRSQVCGMETIATSLKYSDDLGEHEMLAASFKTDTCNVSLTCDDLSREEFTELLVALTAAVTGNSPADSDSADFIETTTDDIIIY